MCNEHGKYSRFYHDLIMEYNYIQYLSFKKVSEFIKLNYSLEINYRRVYELYNKTIDSFKLMNYKEVK